MDTLPSGVERAIENLRAEALDHGTRYIYDRIGEHLAPWGEAGRVRCRADLNWHLDFLLGAVAVGDPGPFVNYLSWLVDLMRSYGVPGDSVELSVEGLASVLRKRLSSEQWAEVAPILAAGIQSLASGGVASADAAGGIAPTHSTDSDVAPATRQQLMSALVAGDAVRASGIVSGVTRQCGYLRMAEGLVQPVMSAIGEMWQRREISVAQEHLASAVIQKLLVREFVNAPFADPVPRSVLLACVASNYHQLGLRILADAFELKGWSVEFLGGDTPTGDLVRHVESTRPDLVALSLSLGRQIPILKDVVAGIRERLGSGPPRIIAGGPGLTGLGFLCPRLGLDGCYPSVASVPDLGP
ncbi:B12 binding domain protein [Thioalkalivibrio nitratireducens DSM 14787]|uniref:B12 binding domain protein n=1 Tax=Thioalkalivibrio nitratireducens (strain DSM 14787 / UNIQEM 213 / ALEN2) TaxID=1255043 RepID=L0DUJ9_THIND|nr:cobalamin-dependent protein [Thioalkalivibrio nitratireducens]AGA32703.1 B12 binding domain protein [Thioalkalivibrio nitratireducens DSM 14787]